MNEKKRQDPTQSINRLDDKNDDIALSSSEGITDTLNVEDTNNLATEIAINREELSDDMSNDTPIDNINSNVIAEDYAQKEEDVLVDQNKSNSHNLMAIPGLKDSLWKMYILRIFQFFIKI